MSWATDGRNPAVRERRDLAGRADRVLRVAQEFGLDGAYALSHVVWPEHEGGPPAMHTIERAVRKHRRSGAMVRR